MLYVNVKKRLGLSSPIFLLQRSRPLLWVGSGVKYGNKAIRGIPNSLNDSEIFIVYINILQIWPRVGDPCSKVLRVRIGNGSKVPRIFNLGPTRRKAARSSLAPSSYVERASCLHRFDP